MKMRGDKLQRFRLKGPFCLFDYFYCGLSVVNNIIHYYCQAGALNALYLGRRGYKVDVYESKESMIPPQFN